MYNRNVWGVRTIVSNDTKTFLVMGKAEKVAWLMEDRDEQILPGNGVFVTRNHTVMSLCCMWTYKLSLAEYPTLHNLWLFLRWNFSVKNASMLFLWKRAPPDCEDAVHSLEKEYLSGCCSTLLFFSGKSWQEVGKPFRCKISRVSSAEAAHPQQSKVRKDISESGTRAEDSESTGG